MQNRQYTVPNSGALAINIIICIQLLDACCLTPLQIDWKLFWLIEYSLHITHDLFMLRLVKW